MPGILLYSEEEEMRRKKSIVWAVTALLMAASLVLASCGGGQPTAAAEPPAQEPTEVQAEPTEAATEAPAGTEDPAATGEPVVITGENYSPDIPEPAEPVTVTWATWINTESPFWAATIAAFEEVHPNIKIEVQSVPGEEMFDKLLAQIAAGNPPDTAYVSDWMTGALAQNEGLAPLDDYIAKSTIIDIDDYVPAYLEPSRVGDVQYGLPFAGETTMLFYRTDRFEEVGLDPNHPPETWEEFQEYAEKLTDTANAKYGFAVFAPEAAFYFYPWLWQAGGEQLSTEDPNDVIWDSPEGREPPTFTQTWRNTLPRTC
jgi:multiple sugar transport system substrate-binding protein